MHGGPRELPLLTLKRLRGLYPQGKNVQGNTQVELLQLTDLASCELDCSYGMQVNLGEDIE